MADIVKCYIYADEGDTSLAPMAAAIANHLAAQRGLDCKFISAGIYAKEGTPVDPLAVRAVRELYGLDISGHTSVAVTPELHRTTGLQRVMDTRLRSLYNDRAHVWPQDGAFALIKPAGKEYAAYRACAEYLYTNISNQLERLVEEGRILVKDGN